MVRVWGGEQTRRCPLTKQRVKTLLVNHSSLREVQPQHIKNKNYPGKVSFLFATRQLNPFLVVGYGGEAELPTAIKAEMPAGMDMLHGQALPLLRWACAQLTSHVLLFATPWTVACQAPLSMEFLSMNTGVGSHSLLQRIFPTQGWDPHLRHWEVDSLPPIWEALM